MRVSLWCGSARSLGLLAAMGLAVAACSGGTGLPDASVMDAQPSTGRFTVAWTLADGARTLTCDDVGGQVLSVAVTGPAIGGGYAEAFSCANGVGTSKALPAGVYDLAFELVGKSGSLATPAGQRVTIAAGGTVTAAPLSIALAANGKLDSKLVAGGAAANCAGASAIAALSIVLEKGGACVPATFTIAAAGGRPGGVYASTCATPASTTVCVERDQAITTSVGSGAYTIKVVGALAGGAPCWVANQLADIPPLGRTLTMDIGLAYQKGMVVGCP